MPHHVDLARLTTRDRVSTRTPLAGLPGATDLTNDLRRALDALDALGAER